MNINSNFFERILQIIEYYGIKNVNNFALNWLNYSSSEKINRLKKENTNPSYEIIIDITNKFDKINPEWLLTGNGPMLKKDIHNNVSDEQNTKMLACQPNNNKYRQIPFVEQSAVAGFGSSDFSLSSQDVKSSYVIPKFKDCKIDFMIEIRGTSMYPKYNSGDVIACTIIRESNFIQWNKVHLIATREQGLLVKRIKKSSTSDKITAVSDNPDYDPFEIPKEEITGIALVVGIIRLE